jgi:hypothetical protein
MRKAATGLALIAIGLSASSTAPAQTAARTCAELTALVSAAKETPPFASVPWTPHPPVLGFDNCSILDMMPGVTPPSFGCITDFPDSVRRWEQLNADILRCLPDAEPFEDPGQSPPKPPDRHAGFLAGGGRVQIDTVEAGYANRRRRYVAIHIEPQQPD